MKRLLLIRHGKSEPAAESGNDFDRKLAPRGYRDGKLMVEHLFSRIDRPDRLVVSTARRAAQTGEIIATALGEGVVCVHSDALYLADPGTIWDVAVANFEEGNSVWLVGHNPGMHEAVALFTGGWVDSLPTFGVVTIDFEELLPKRGRLTGHYRPSTYR